MPRMDWSEVPQSDYSPGIYLAQVKKCEVKNSQRTGDPYFNVEWHEAGGAFGEGGLICWDILMMAGKARSLAQAKLKVLGFRGDEPSIEPEDLVGRRAWIRVDWQEYKGGDGEMKRSLKVTSQFRPEFQSGYWNEKMPPEGAGKAQPATDDIPF